MKMVKKNEGKKGARKKKVGRSMPHGTGSGKSGKKEGKEKENGGEMNWNCQEKYGEKCR